MNPRATLGDPAVPLTEFRRIDAACDRFEDDFREGRDPDLAEHLSGVPDEARARLFRDLLGLDLDYRRRRGERPEARGYRARFPELVDVVDSVFRSMTERPDAGAAAAVSPESDPASPVDSRADTRRIDRDGDASGMAEPLRGGMGRAEYDDLRSAGYEVLGLLGRGGMGVVYEARQVALDRVVALKLVRSGSFASESELLRFRNEAEAVARLDHPHIVPIYEVGARGGRHFFSMKRIAGPGLDRRIDEFAADPRAAARLVAAIAEAIHHAHQRGILHRDLKPANILIDERGQPHVTDFGLAKRIDGDAELTQSNALVGTPAYMAPEQTTRGLGAVSTATDVYGLGTILYALLAGRAPFTGTTLVETLDMVRTQYPEPPSKLNPRVPRDLEVICRKCLEKEPARRYSSALALSEDLMRWLGGEPILARPVGPMVRSALWCRRNPIIAGAAAMVVVSFIVGFAGVTWKWREAVRERARSEAVIDLLANRLLARADTEFDPLGRNPTIREVLDDVAARLGGWLDGQDDVEAHVRETIGGAYLSLGRFPPAEQQLVRAIELDARANGPDGRVGLLATNLLGTLRDRTGRPAEAEPMLRRNLAACRKALGPDDPATLDADERLATVLWHLGRLDEAEAALRRSLADRGRVFKPDHAVTLRSVYLLSRLLRDRRRFDEARDLAYRYAHDIQCARGSNHPDMILALTNQGDVARDRGARDEAERYYRHAAAEASRILGPEHRVTLEAEANLGRFLATGADPPR
jgi:tetratricopeptide (TPR) repeat protein/predicted Ser/Thr protein kinase